jgi:hypothetical protein
MVDEDERYRSSFAQILAAALKFLLTLFLYTNDVLSLEL